MTTHVSTYSLGGGSWLAARIVQRELVRPGDDHLLAFTDTLYEDADAYRFGIQGALHIFGRPYDWVPAAEDFPDYRADPDTPIEDYAGNPAWRDFLRQLRERAAEEVPELVWLVEGRDPWEIFRDERYLGNSRQDPCSKFGKRGVLDSWIKSACSPDDTIVYFGIGSGEAHRYETVDPKTGKPQGIRPRWAAMGWEARAPLIGRVEGDLSASIYIRAAGLAVPRLYEWYAHNNCGGMCCKAGQKHWKARLAAQPDRYAYDSLMEQKFREFLGKDVAFMTDRRNKTKRPLTLAEWADRIRNQPEASLPEPEDGDDGCGCMTEAPADEAYA